MKASLAFLAGFFFFGVTASALPVGSRTKFICLINGTEIPVTSTGEFTDIKKFGNIMTRLYYFDSAAAGPADTWGIEVSNGGLTVQSDSILIGEPKMIAMKATDGGTEVGIFCGPQP